MDKSKYKYRINELLNTLPVLEFKKALRIFPSELKISVPTFNNYRNIKIDDAQDIPHEKVMILERLFNIAPGELANFTIHNRSLAEIRDTGSEGDTVVEKFGMTR